MQRFTLIYAIIPEMKPIKDKLPAGRCWGFTAQTKHGCFIIIDGQAGNAAQNFTLRHELAHLALGHLSRTKPLSEICTTGDDMFGEGWIDRENEADKYAAEMTDTEFANLMQYADSVLDAGRDDITRVLNPARSV